MTEVKEKELGILRKRCKEAVDPEEKEKLKFLVRRTENQLRSERQKDEKERESLTAAGEIKASVNKKENIPPYLTPILGGGMLADFIRRIKLKRREM